MDEIAFARALHVLAVVLWIGGVGFVTTVLLPSVRRLKGPDERLALFDSIERRFAWQARGTTLMTGATGLYMLVRLDLWQRFSSAMYWWMDAMVLVWAVFTLMLFVAEPLVLHRWLTARAKTAPQATFNLVERLHWVLLTLSLITVLGAVAGSHGFVLFDY
ncbi:MAG TPA: hypothetical protein HPQ04_05865 [Rhodospirillaceae bacterium]|nr:hypothetical protein [Rhodospirillaceae bacterium]